MNRCQKSPRTTRQVGMLLVLFGCLGFSLLGCGQPPQDAAADSAPGGELTPGDRLLRTGLDEAGRFAEAVPFEVDEAVLKRGKETFLAKCMTCHGANGNGRGPVFQSTGVLASDLRTEYVQGQPPGQHFVVVSRGMGLMLGFEAQLSVQDRWAVVAYLRTLEQEEGE